MSLFLHNALTERGQFNPPAVDSPKSDVCLILEGTYPFVSGGVSSWVHSLIKGLPDISFGLFVILPDDAAKKLKYQLPKNVTGLTYLYLSRQKYEKKSRFHFWKSGAYLKKILLFHLNLPEFSQSRELGIRKGTEITAQMERTQTLQLRQEMKSLISDFHTILATLSDQQWDIPSRLLSRKTWRTIRALYNKKRHNCSFVDYYLTWKYLHSSIFAIVNAYIPKATVYHAISTGYAGLIGARAHIQQNSPLILTEHGIYNKERKIDISRSNWIYEERRHLFRAQENLEVFKELWIKAFTVMSKICYASADSIITLYTGNQAYQLQDGANPDNMRVIPNGIDYLSLSQLKKDPQERPIIGFVGRIVPIKDVKTFLRAMALVIRSHPKAEAWLMGPVDENEEYYEECRQLTEFLEIKENVRFTGMVDLRHYYPKLDILVLTSISEAQPLVVLEAYCLKIPVVVTDVGGCGELVEGMPGEDRKMGKSGLTTGLANPTETAISILYLMNHPEEAKKMGEIGNRRVRRYYNLPKLFERYREIYASHQPTAGQKER